MHLNGAFAPLVSAVIPQDAYSSATVTVARCDFTNISLTPSGRLLTADFEQGLCSQGTGLTTVSLPLPIVISGTSAVLSLDLQVTQSYTLTTTQGINGPTQSYTISPSFILTPLSISAQPVSGFVTALDLRFASLSAVGNSFCCDHAKRVVPELGYKCRHHLPGCVWIVFYHTGGACRSGCRCTSRWVTARKTRPSERPCGLGRIRRPMDLYQRPARTVRHFAERLLSCPGCRCMRKRRSDHQRRRF